MITNRNLKFFQKARALTKYSDYRDVHIGCVIVSKNKIIGEGFNTYKTHPMQKKFDVFRDLNVKNEVSHLHALHAEIMALASIKDTNVDLSKAEVYIYRKMKRKPFGMVRPCPACMQALKLNGIKHIYYTSNNGLAYENISLEAFEKIFKKDAV